MDHSKEVLKQQFLALVEQSETEEFCVNFEDAWQWLEYSRKSKAKEFVVSNFEKNIDYSISLLECKTPSGGRPSESILLTTDCFKMWSMMAGTTKGKEVRKWYLEVEKEWKQLKLAPKAPAIPDNLNQYLLRLGMAEEVIKQVPKGYFCIYEKAQFLMKKIMDAGYPVGLHDLVDGSIGIHWANYRKGKEWARETKYYPIDFPDGDVRNKAYPAAKCYSIFELPYFQIFLDDVFLPEKFPVYIKKKYGAIVKA